MSAWEGTGKDISSALCSYYTVSLLKMMTKLQGYTPSLFRLTIKRKQTAELTSAVNATKGCFSGLLLFYYASISKSVLLVFFFFFAAFKTTSHQPAARLMFTNSSLGKVYRLSNG